MMLVGVCVVMAKIANMENQSGPLWVGIAFLLCMASLMVPLPFLRILLAGILAYILMFVRNMIRSR